MLRSTVWLVSGERDKGLGGKKRGEDLVYIRLPEPSTITHHRSVIHSILRQYGT